MFSGKEIVFLITRFGILLKDTAVAKARIKHGGLSSLYARHNTSARTVNLREHGIVLPSSF